MGDLKMSQHAKQYKARIYAAGFTMSSWARYCGTNRSTVVRQCSGYIPEIRKLFWMALDAIDGEGWPDDE